MSADDEPATSLYHGLVEDLGEPSLAQRVMESLRRRFGGQRVYIEAPPAAARAAEIRSRYNGRNRIEICHEYGISRARLYQIVGRKR